MFEIPEKQPVKVKIYGQEYSLKKPTLAVAEQAQESLKGADSVESLRLLKDFLIGVGMPEASLKEMEMDHIIQLVEFLSGAKKK